MRGRSRKRSRSRKRRGDGPPYLAILLAVGAVFVLLPTVFNSAAFTAVDLGRSGSIDVVADENGALTLDAVTAVSVGNRERLFTLTNRLNQSASVTASITGGSATLYTGTQSGSTVSFSLAKGASRTVDVQAGGTGGDTIDYEIQATGSGMTATVDRSVQSLSAGQAAPGYPASFNDIDYPACGSEEPNENNTIPPGCVAPGEISNFPNMQVASDGGAYSHIESRDGSLDVGVVIREVPDVTDYEIRLQYALASWSDDPTINFVEADGTVLQSTTLEHTDSVMEPVFVELNAAANSYVNSNDVLYVTFTGGGGVQVDVDYLRIQEDTPPPDAAFTASCSGQDCTFDGSASSGFGKPLVSYDWTFGDGDTESTTSSVTTHNYTANGTYNVKLTVENSAGETDTTSKLVTVGTLSPVHVPPDVYDDIEDWDNEPEAPNEENDIPPPNPQGNKLQNFDDMKQVDGATATLPGNPMDIGVATLGVSDQGSAYALKIRHAQDNWEGKVEVLIVDGNNTVLQSHELPKTQGNLQNTTITFNSAAESHVKNTGNVYVRYHKTTGGWVDLEVDAHIVEVTP